MSAKGVSITPNMLRAARALLNLTQKDVVDVTGISSGTLVKLEKEGVAPIHPILRESVIAKYREMGIVFRSGGVLLPRVRKAA